MPVGVEGIDNDLLLTVIVLFCFSGTGIYGALAAGFGLRKVKNIPVANMTRDGSGDSGERFLDVSCAAAAWVSRWQVDIGCDKGCDKGSDRGSDRGTDLLSLPLSHLPAAFYVHHQSTMVYN